MKISIVTVAYNSEKTIRQTIESVLNQTYTNIEYLIIDGKSTDKTVEIAKSYEKKFYEKGIEYRIISEKDNGIYDAMNKGASLATGKFVAMLNSDDWYEPCAVETVVNTYNEQPFDMFYGDIRIIKENGDTIVKHSRYDKIATSRHWNHPTSFISKEIYNQMQYKCEGIHDDFDLFLRIRKAGKKIVIKNVVMANFRIGGVSNNKTLKKCRERFQNRYHIYRENGYSKLYVIECLAIETVKFLIG